MQRLKDYHLNRINTTPASSELDAGSFENFGIEDSADNEYF